MSGRDIVKTILYLSTSSGPGGAERVISNLASSLDPEDIERFSVYFAQAGFRNAVKVVVCGLM